MRESFLSLGELEPDRVGWLLGVAAEVRQKPEAFADALRGRTLALTLDVDGSRARVSFLRAMSRLGGAGVFVPARDLGVRAAERPAAAAALLSRFADALVASFAEEETLRRFAAAATVPVINGATAAEHPCQALADLMVLAHLFPGEHGPRVAWVGPPTAELYGLALGAPATGVELVVAAPADAPFDQERWHRAAARAAAAGARLERVELVVAAPADAPFDEERWHRAAARAAAAGARLEQVDEPAAAARGADALYASPAPGGPWVDAALLAAARDDAVLLHTLPLGVEGGVDPAGLPEGVSAALLQAEMRVPVQQALLLWLLEAV